MENEADAKVRTKAPIPEDEQFEAIQNPETAAREKYWQAYSTVPHYMHATKNTKKNKQLIQEFRREYENQRGSAEYSDDKLQAELLETLEARAKAIRSLR